MKNFVCLLLIVCAVFLQVQKTNLTRNKNVSADNSGNSGEPAYTPLVPQESQKTLKKNEAFRIRDMARLATRNVLPPAPPEPDQQVTAENIIHVASADELHGALKNAQPGDFIYIADGIYQGNFEASVDGTAEARITLYGSRRAIIEGDSLTSGYGFHLKADYWTLAGFTVRNVSKGIVTDGANHNILKALEVYQIGDEGVHFRSFSSDNRLEQSWIHDTGLQNPRFGEAVYIGSAESNWGQYSDGKADTSDRNVITGNLLGPNVSAEMVDIKEGTTGGSVHRNIFISDDTLVVDSWVNIKGNKYTVSDNAGAYTPESDFRQPVVIHTILSGWGEENTFQNNAQYMETDDRSPFRAAFDMTGAVSIILPERHLPYTLTELLARFPASFEQPEPATLLLKESILVGQNARLVIKSSDVETVRLLSSNKGFVSIMGFRSEITIEGTPDRLVAFQSWDTRANQPDLEVVDGRAYVFMYGGRMDISYAAFADLGFEEGTVSGVAWKGFNSGEVIEASRGNVIGSRFTGNYFGAYTYEAVEMRWYKNTFDYNLSYGFDPHDFSNDFIFEENIAHHNGSHGIIFSRGCNRNIIRNNESFDNQGHGIMIDDGKVLPTASNPRYHFPVPSNDNVIEHNKLWNNNDGVVLEGGSGNIIRHNEIRDSRRYGIRLTDDVNGSLIVSNKIQNSKQYGIFLTTNSYSNTITENTIMRGRAAIALRDSDSNKIIANRIKDSSRVAFILVGEVSGSTIEKNVLSANTSRSPFRISRAVGLTVETLSKKNNLSAWKPATGASDVIHTGALATQMLIFLIPVLVMLLLTMRKLGMYPVAILSGQKRKSIG